MLIFFKQPQGTIALKKDYDRFVALFKQQSVSTKELDDMTARYEMAP
jgi:multidrug resistance efflux pump